jgi:Fe-S oxidoreductase
MSMTPQMQEAFSFFYGMVNNIKDLYQPVEMPDAERVSRARQTFVTGLTGNMATALESCVHCGLCAEACHYYQGTHDPKYTPVHKLDLVKRVYRRELSPLRLLHRLYTPDITADDLREWQELVFDSCTICGRCTMVCPMGIHIADLVVLNRMALAEAGLIPPELEVMRREQSEQGTIFSANEEVLRYKADELSRQLGFEIPLNKPGADIMVLSSGLDLMLFNDALAGTSKLLQHLGRPWTIFTDAYEGANFGMLSGHEATMHKAVERVVRQAEAAGVKVVLTPECGHAYPALRWDGAELMGRQLPFTVMTVSEYFGREVMEGRLKLRKVASPKAVALHDPCKVGRWGGAFDEPRALLAAMGLTVKETASHHETNWCCGGGAGVFLIGRAADLRQRAYEIKMGEVKATGTERLVVSCGSCRLNFETGKMKARDSIEIDSLVALAAEHIA